MFHISSKAEGFDTIGFSKVLLNQINQLMVLFKALEGLHPSYEMSPWFLKKHSVDGFLSTEMKANHI